MFFSAKIIFFLSVYMLPNLEQVITFSDSVRWWDIKFRMSKHWNESLLVWNSLYIWYRFSCFHTHNGIYAHQHTMFPSFICTRHTLFTFRKNCFSYIYTFLDDVPFIISTFTISLMNTSQDGNITSKYKRTIKSQIEWII